MACSQGRTHQERLAIPVTLRVLEERPLRPALPTLHLRTVLLLRGRRPDYTSAKAPSVTWKDWRAGVPTWCIAIRRLHTVLILVGRLVPGTGLGIVRWWGLARGWTCVPLLLLRRRRRVAGGEK